MKHSDFLELTRKQCTADFENNPHLHFRKPSTNHHLKAHTLKSPQGGKGCLNFAHTKFIPAIKILRKLDEFKYSGFFRCFFGKV